MKMQLTFKSGAQVIIECDTWEQGNYGSYYWTSKGSKDKLVSFDASSLDCVVRLTP